MENETKDFLKINHKDKNVIFLDLESAEGKMFLAFTTIGVVGSIRKFVKFIKSFRKGA